MIPLFALRFRIGSPAMMSDHRRISSTSGRSCVVQVERTGRGRRKPGLIHAEDLRE